ncbi:MAG: phosphoribosyl-AMP cyclohydrolase [Pseudomonadota bacterium]
MTFAERGNKDAVEGGTAFQPKFDAQGLIPAIVTAADDGTVLMFAWMNRDALARTLETREAHFWSRSRAKLWLKGEESGNRLAVQAVRADCDQDVIEVVVTVAGNGVACHTGERSCFYRAIELDRIADGHVTLKRIETA